MVETLKLFDITFSNITFEEVRTQFAQRIESGEPAYVVTPNVDHVCRIQVDPDLRAAYEDAFLVLADGMPVIWASKLLGCPLVEKLSGSDLVPLLCEFASQRGYSDFFFGAAEGIAAEAAQRMCERYPGLKVAGAYSPPMGFERDPEKDAEAVSQIREADPDFCFVALGAPRQEIWMHRHYRDMGSMILLGIGAGLDFVAGRLKRAPRWMQNVGLEWLWRLSQEPRRLWRRYLVDDLSFFVLLWRELRKRRTA